MAITSAILAFTLFTTFSIGRAIKERIQLQNAADASAYSLAVMEARAFNFYAYTNRAIISHFVAMMAVYGHMSYLAYYQGVLYDMGSAWGCSCGGSGFNIQDQLYAWWGFWCGVCIASWGSDCSQCFGDADCVPNEISSINDTCNNLCNKLNDVNNQVGYPNSTGNCFEKLHDIAKQHREGASASVGSFAAGTGFSLTLRNEQQAMDNDVLSAIGSPLSLPPGKGQDLTKQIAQQFDPHYGVGKDAAHALLVSALSLAGVAGDSDTAGYCKTGVTGNGAVTSPLCLGSFTSLSTQQQAANASRYGPATLGSSDWLRDRPDGLLSPINALILAEWWHGYPRISALTGGTGMDRETADPSSGALSVIHSSQQGGYSGSSGGGGSTSLAAEDHGTLISSDYACISDLTFGVYWSSPQVWVYSMPQSKGPSVVHWADGSETKTDDYDMGACTGSQCGVGYATINFNPSSDSAGLFNEPHTWAVVTKSFNDANLTAAPTGRNYSDTTDQGPYAMKRTFTGFGGGGTGYTYNNGITQSGVDGRDAMYAIAQGLTYYHRPGNWEEPPNFYNPFWRAKLHPMQMGNSTSKNGKLDVGEAMIAAGYPAASAAQLSLLPVTE
ncbi:MAG TPA: hypothetical protein VMB50_08125 [Myxococcales bacterium]|nr:hypothetical protein [Myxococcales bacterium]